MPGAQPCGEVQTDRPQLAVQARLMPAAHGHNSKTSSFCSSATRMEHGDRRVVGKQIFRGEHVLAQSVVQGLQPPACAANPACQRRTTKIDTVASKDLRLSIERRVIAITC